MEVHSVQRGSAAIRHRALERLGCTQYTTTTGSLCTKTRIKALAMVRQHQRITLKHAKKKKKKATRKLLRKFIYQMWFSSYVAPMRMNCWYFLRRNGPYFFFSAIFHREKSVIFHFWVKATWVIYDSFCRVHSVTAVRIIGAHLGDCVWVWLRGHVRLQFVVLAGP